MENQLPRLGYCGRSTFERILNRTVYTPTEVLEFYSVMSLGTLAFFTPLWAPWLAFRGVGTKSPGLNRVNIAQYSMLEFGSVFGYVAIANSIYSLMHGEYQDSKVWSLAMPVLCTVFAILMWVLSLKFVNRKQIVEQRPRLLIILFFFPASSILMSHFISAILGLFSSVELMPDGISAYFQHPMVIGLIWLLLSSIAAIVFLRYGYRKVIGDGTMA